MTKLISHTTKTPLEEFRDVEPLLTVQYAAKALGIHVWALRRAVKAGTIPAYTPFNGRKLVRLSEVIAYIDSCRQGGVDA